MTRPGSALTSCDVARARLPFGRVMSMTLPCRLGAASNCAELIASRMPSVSLEARLGRDAGEDAAVGAGDDDVPAGGDAPGRDQVGQQGLQPLDIGQARSCLTEARRSMRSAR